MQAVLESSVVLHTIISLIHLQYHVKLRNDIRELQNKNLDVFTTQVWHTEHPYELSERKTLLYVECASSHNLNETTHELNGTSSHVVRVVPTNIVTQLSATHTKLTSLRL